MSWADKAKSGGGGFLNNVDATIVGYRFTNEFPSENAKQDEEPNLYMVLTVREDGADEDIETTLFGGSATYLEVSEDGFSIKGVDNPPKLWGSVFEFVNSLESAGFPAEARWPDPHDGVIAFPGLAGSRVRFVQVQVKNDKGETLKRKVKKGKFAGKEFAVTNLQVSKVYELGPMPGDANAPVAKKSTNGSGKRVVAQTMPETTGGDESLVDEADAVIYGIVDAAKTKRIKHSDISLAVTRTQTSNPRREELRRLIFSEPYLVDATERGVIVFDAVKRTVSLPEATA